MDPPVEGNEISNADFNQEAGTSSAERTGLAVDALIEEIEKNESIAQFVAVTAEEDSFQHS